MKQLLTAMLLAAAMLVVAANANAQAPPKRIHSFQTPAQVMSVAFSPDGRMLASGGFDKEVTLWEISTGKKRAILKGHTETVRSVAFSPDGKTVASGSWDKTIKLWQIGTGKLPITLAGHDGRVNSVAFNHDGTMLASGGKDATVRIWEVATGKCTTQLNPLGVVNCVAFNSNGKALAAGGWDKSVRVWEIPSGKETVAFAGNQEQFYCVAFSPDGNYVASAADNVNLWDLRSGKELVSHPEFPPRSNKSIFYLAFNPKSGILAFKGLERNKLQLWDGMLSKSRLALDVFSDFDLVHSVTFDPSGTLLASAGSDLITVWKSPSAFVTFGQRSSSNWRQAIHYSHLIPPAILR